LNDIEMIAYFKAVHIDESGDRWYDRFGLPPKNLSKSKGLGGVRF
jgi:hypothetical protein